MTFLKPIADSDTDIIQQLQGIPYSYDRTPPGINCFDLAQTVRSTFNASPLPNFDAELTSYPTEKLLPNDRILHLLQNYCQPVVEDPASHLDLAALRFRGVIALGSVIEVDGDRFVVFMKRNRSSAVEPIENMGRTIDSLWRYEG